MSDALVSLLVACIPAVASLIGVVSANKKTTALISYRLEQLEKKVDKHNHIVERMYSVEGRLNEAEHDIRDLKGVKAS